MVLLATLVAGCAGLYGTVVTITTVMDNAAKSYAHVYNQGGVTAEVDAKVEAAHAEYRKAAAYAELTLITYRDNPNQEETAKVLAAVKVAAFAFLNEIEPLIVKSTAVKLKSDLTKASKL